ncbi:ABC transporter G family member 32 [Bienertia sinuspersici]
MLQIFCKRTDQGQYWSDLTRAHQYVPVEKFAEAFRFFPVGSNLCRELFTPFNRRNNHPAALSTSSYGVKNWELLKIGYSWQKLLIKRNSFIYVFKFIQLLFVASITMTVFFRTKMHHNTIDDGSLYVGALYFSMVIILFNGFTEVSMLVMKLPVIYKHRELHFYPSWVYAIPSWLLSIPTSLMEAGVWVVVTYYVIGYDPTLFKQFLLFFLIHQMSLGLFRVMGSLGRNMIVANTFGSFAMLVVMGLGGYIISRDSIPRGWVWGFWISPLMYGQNAASVNEFLGHSWDKPFGNTRLGEAVLKSRSLFTESYWYWIGVGAMVGYIVLFNMLFIFFLTYLNPLEKRQAVISKSEFQDIERKRRGETVAIQLREFLEHSGSVNGKANTHRGMVLPFQPLSMSFSNINYFVDVPLEMKQQGISEDRLQLLVDVTGAFRPGVLTALVGVSGAGKTTLMDVLAGRKTGGYIEGSIFISGYPKKQETFARISGYCEQNDIHSPCLTVLESLLFSAWLRLSSEVDLETQMAFVNEVMELVELTSLSGALVGLPGIDGLSTEQRKRLTIAVELVANPSIIFMDEPTTGLDARSAAIVMRTVRNIVNTGRTIVCTIHQPSVDIFESFDELLFMSVEGKSFTLVHLDQDRSGRGAEDQSWYNPAAWMLEVTSMAEEARLDVDFAEIYKRSHLFQENQQDIINAMGSLYAAVLFLGVTNGTAVQPVVSVERFVSYRERAAGLYSALPFAFAQVAIEFPYVFVQTIIYAAVFYAMASFEWTAVKFIWYLFFTYFTVLYFTFFGMMTTAITPNHNKIPVWWRWYYWLNPVAWSLYGLLTSQYGDVNTLVKLSDGVHSVPIKLLLKDGLGFRHDFVSIAAIVVASFWVLFAVIFAYAIKAFNFQKR